MIPTDHASLFWLRNFKNPEGMLARWISNLENDYELVHRKGTLHGNADSLSRIPYPNCKRTDCPDCKSRSSSSHAAAKTDKNDFISLISVASFQNDMKDDLPDCLTSYWLDSWTHNDLVEMQRNDLILSKFITLKQTYDTKPGKEVVENYHLELRLLVK